MKIRSDFVTNSSSSSFIIEKIKLTDNQLFAIRENSGLGGWLGIEYAEEGWFVEENDLFIRGSTYMDNYNINTLFVLLGIDKNVAWVDLHASMPETQEEFNSLRNESDTRHEDIDDVIDRYRRCVEFRNKAKAIRRECVVEEED